MRSPNCDKTASIWRNTTASVLPAARSACVSPTQTTGVSPTSMTAAAFAATVASLSPIQRASLRMPDDRIRASKLGDHACRNFSGECAACMLAHVLRTPGDRRARQRSLRLPQVGKRHADRDAATFARRPAPANRRQQRVVLLQASVHFPVADDELAAHRSRPCMPVFERGGRYPCKPLNFTPPRQAGSTRCAATWRRRNGLSRLADAGEAP